MGVGKVRVTLETGREFQRGDLQGCLAALPRKGMASRTGLCFLSPLGGCSPAVSPPQEKPRSPLGDRKECPLPSSSQNFLGAGLCLVGRPVLPSPAHRFKPDMGNTGGKPGVLPPAASGSLKSLLGGLARPCKEAAPASCAATGMKG